MAIDHNVRAGRLWPVLTECAKSRSTITYGQAAERIGIHHRAMAYALEPIQSHCLNRLPPLTALVVNSSTGRQGGGYIAGDVGDDVDLNRVFEFDWSSAENPFPNLPEAEMDALAEALTQNPDVATEILALVSVRGDAQRLFRKSVLLAYGNKCAICGLSFAEALEAAHIVPWSNGNPAARIDPRNGLLLCANHHRLFDTGRLNIDPDFRITFTDPEMNAGSYSNADRDLTARYHGLPVNLPYDERLHPSRAYLIQRTVRS